MAKSRVFISIPMGGYSQEEIEENIHKVKAAYEDRFGTNVEFIDSFFNDTDSNDWSPARCLAESLKLLSSADIAVFVKGWDKYRGCRLEHEFCNAYDIKFVEFVMDLF